MFQYYGRKKRFIDLYPSAQYECIIEPFAGSASYACVPSHRERTVQLIERDAQIVDLWHRIQQMTPFEVEQMPDLTPGEVTDDLFHLLHMASKRWHTYRKATVTPIMAKNWNTAKRYYAEMLPFVRNWDVRHADYRDAPDVEATWFIDPPYPGDPGTGYRHGSADIDFGELAEWCQSRRGQVIVCSAATDTWLPFQLLTVGRGVGGKGFPEGIWTNRPEDLRLQGLLWD